MTPRACLLLALLASACDHPTAPAPPAEPTPPAPSPADAPAPDPAPAPAAGPATPAPVTPAHAAAPAPTAGEPSRELEVLARLVEPNQASHCGVVRWVVVMRYEVVRVLAGTYDRSVLYVAHSCPELTMTPCRDHPGDRIDRHVAGDLHRLRLLRGRGDGALVDKFADPDVPRYRSRCGSREPAP
jgi:hypothetical protein